MNDPRNQVALAQPMQGGALAAPAPQAQYEVAVAAAAAGAKAAVLARYEMALRRPRDWDDVRAQVLKECRRPSFAFDKSALYSKPVGGQKVTGLGVRFAEMALLRMGNVLVETETRYEDEGKEIIRVTVTDIESNVTWPLDIPVAKTVERRNPAAGAEIMGQRLNSYGDVVFLVRANDDELLTKRAALISKAARTLAMRIIPGDLQAEAEETIKAIRQAEAAKDPDAERKRILDAFAALNVKPSDVSQYLGHDVGQCTPAQLVELRALHGALHTGETSWAAVMREKRESEGGTPPAPPAPPRKDPPTSAAPPKAPAPAPEPAPAPAEGGATGGGDAPLVDGEPPAEPAGLGEKQNLKRAVQSRPGADMRMLLDLIGATTVDAETLEGLTKAQWKAAKMKLGA
ncbi:hypothetical protein UFOVP703_6 [uncultured Caudovirales phage]|uniref:Uncharacterized protein n=1 Tax=uncultured Caudovirales phage TaxID=2100421 RepID=A0A6J5NI32_9CAUD|nr:hypothetical protein UFOVP703_6 [uncultured Caudovirales phage]